MSASHLDSTFLRLRPDTSIETLPVDADFWPRLIGGQLGDFHHEYLVSHHGFDADWQSWEMHPCGDEIVCLLAGSATMVLENPDGTTRSVELAQPGSFAFVPRGTWHTAQVPESAKMLFITAGEGTQHRAR